MGATIRTPTLHSLAFLYMAFSTVTDGELAPEELDTLAQRLKRWIGQGSGVRLIDVVEEAGRVYDEYSCDDDIWRAAHHGVCRLRAALDVAARRQVIADLVAIAESDRVICEGEISFLSMVMRAFGLGEPNPLTTRPRA